MRAWLCLLPLVLVLSACGQSASDYQAHQAKPRIVGIVTAKIAPAGSNESCTTIDVYGNQSCTIAGQYEYAVWIEPLPGHEYTYGEWTEQRSLVCVAPSYWHKLQIGSLFDAHHRGNDLHCDG